MGLAISSFSPSADPPASQRLRGDSEAHQHQKTQANTRQRSPQQFSAEEQRVLRELQSTDQAVRIHEAAHKAAGGSLTGGASFTYQTGPDHRRYAVGGEVSIDTSPERDPRATIAKMRQVIAAALAPGDPSAQDRAVAAQARATQAEAERQLSQSTRPVDKAYGQSSATVGRQVDVVA